MKVIQITTLFLIISTLSSAQNAKNFEIKSPNGNFILNVEIADKIKWSANHEGETIIEPSVISLKINNDKTLGINSKIKSSKKEEVRTEFETINYNKSVIQDIYNQLTIKFKDNFSLTFRVYNDAVAYRFSTQIKDDIIIQNEIANFNFSKDYLAFIPYMREYRSGSKYNSAFEALYTEEKISKFKKDTLAFTPMLIDLEFGKKLLLVEADLEDYPGMFLTLNETGKGLKGEFAAYPRKINQQGIPTEREDYIAKTNGQRDFPWRAIVISKQDKDLLNCDIVQKLASPCRIDDISWIKPGQVAWDWWSPQNITHVDFKAGINTETYKYYIDFASANNVPYIVMDGGWSSRGDLKQTRETIDLPQIVQYGKEKKVGIILWAGWNTLITQLDEVFKFYGNMGIKGFKIDYIDRDDQVAVASTYEIAKKASKHHLLIDFHGVFKPTGLQRTYPNIVGYEGVRGMEAMKWLTDDVLRYEVTLPYIRNLAGPMDYTPGAMRNATKEHFRAITLNPMSQGTRCHQMAMYVVQEVPLQMLSDNPTTYMKEQECTDFITKVPVAYDKTYPLDGKVGEYVAIARKKENAWFIGAMTNWTPRELTIDLSFLDEGKYKAVIFKDGINADRQATDYKKEVIEISKKDKVTISLSPGGGWVARLEKL